VKNTQILIIFGKLNPEYMLPVFLDTDQSHSTPRCAEIQSCVATIRFHKLQHVTVSYLTLVDNYVSELWDLGGTTAATQVVTSGL